MNVPRPHIMIATPCYGGLLNQGYVEAIVVLTTYAPAEGFDVTLIMNGNDSLITRSRNKLVSVFLDNPRFTHLMFIDADIVFRPEDVKRMLDFDEDVAAGMYPVKGIDWAQVKKQLAPGVSEAGLQAAGLNFVGLPYPAKEGEERDGFVTAAYAGTGFMLIKRAVFGKMIASYPETKYMVAQTFPRAAHNSGNQYALFDCCIDPMTGIYLSEDFAFCQRWRKLGGQIWLDTKSQLTHIGVYKYGAKI
jgi:hypothetical protein